MSAVDEQRDRQSEKRMRLWNWAFLVVLAACAIAIYVMAVMRFGG